MQKNTDLEIRIEESKGVRTIHMNGELSIATAGALRKTLLDGLQPGVRTVLEAGAVNAVDLAGLQLMCSAHRTYGLHEAVLEFGRTSECLREAARAAGYEASHSVCPYRRDGNCLWKW